jgi:hypothetical protein
MYWKIGTAKSFLKKLFKMSEALMKKATFLKMALSIPQRKKSNCIPCCFHNSNICSRCRFGW